MENALFDPYSYENLQAWPLTRESQEMSELGVNWYNPAITLLPRRIRMDLSKTFNREVTYLLAFKRNLEKGNCENLKANETEEIDYRVRSRRDPQQFVLADDQMVAFGESLTVVGEYWIRSFLKKCGDIRLELKKDRILAHAHAIVGPLQRRYAFWWLDVKIRDGRAILAASTFSHPDVVVKQESWLETTAQNLGVLWTGHNEDAFSVAYWFGNTLDVRQGIPPNEFPEDEGNETDPVRFLVNGLEDPFDRNVHSNGSPVYLNDICPGLAVAVGHSHLDTELNASQGILSPHNRTKWGNTYVHNLILFNFTTLKTLHVSPAFCFPSVASSSSIMEGSSKEDGDGPLCDVIQFVSGFLRDGAHDLLFGYGINDCESAHIRIPISSVLAFAASGDGSASSFKCPCPPR